MSKVIKSPDIVDPAIVVGDLERRGEQGTGAVDEGDRSAPDLEDDDEFLIQYGEDVDAEIQEDAGPPPDPLAGEQAELERQVEEDRARAKEEGHREGMAAAEAEMAEKLKAAGDRLQKLGDLVDGVESDYRAALDELSRQAVELCLAVGEKLALRTLRDDGDTLAGLFRAAIDRAANDSNLRVRLNPEDEALLADEWETITGARKGDLELELIPDAKIARGGCVIEAGGGSVDATVEHRLDSVRLAVSPPSVGEAADAAPD